MDSIASPAEHPPEWWRNQEDLHAFLGRAIDRFDLDRRGQVTRRIDVDARTFVFLWHGDSPVRGELMDLALADGIHLRFLPCQFSPQQFRAGQERIGNSAGDPGWRGFVLSGIAGPTEEFVGLTVSGYLPAQPADLTGLGPAERRQAGWHGKPWSSAPDRVDCSADLLRELEAFIASLAGVPFHLAPSPGRLNPMPADQPGRGRGAGRTAGNQSR